MYTETLGEWSVWLFYIGAIATLYGTIFAATAGNSRVFADITRFTGLLRAWRLCRRFAPQSLYLVPRACARSYLILSSARPSDGEVGRTGAATMLPIIGIGAVYLRHQRLPKA